MDQVKFVEDSLVKCEVIWSAYLLLAALMIMPLSTWANIMDMITLYSNSEAATKGVLCKKVFLEISQNSQENTCARVSFLIKLQAVSNNQMKLSLDSPT